MAKRTKESFKWIVGILRKYEVPFQVSGGLAARAYGSDRPLVDIDIDIPDKMFDKIVPEVEGYIIYGPKRYVEKPFDVLYMSLRYKGQVIDLTGADSQKLFDREKKKWVRNKANLSKSVKKKLLGMIVPVIPKEELIKYKSIMLRRVDKQDINALKQNYP